MTRFIVVVACAALICFVSQASVPVAPTGSSDLEQQLPAVSSSDNYNTRFQGNATAIDANSTDKRKIHSSRRLVFDEIFDMFNSVMDLFFGGGGDSEDDSDRRCYKYQYAESAALGGRIDLVSEESEQCRSGVTECYTLTTVINVDSSWSSSSSSSSSSYSSSSSSSSSSTYSSASSSTYTMVSSGTCSSNGHQALESRSSCQAASSALSIDSSISTERDSSFPSGCYKYSRGSVYLNSYRGRSCTSTYPCLCLSTSRSSKSSTSNTRSSKSTSSSTSSTNNEVFGLQGVMKSVTGGCGFGGSTCSAISSSMATASCNTCSTDLCNSGIASAPGFALLGTIVTAAIYGLSYE